MGSSGKGTLFCIKIHIILYNTYINVKLNVLKSKVYNVRFFLFIYPFCCAIIELN